MCLIWGHGICQGMTENFQIHSIYLATEGEGVHIGHPQIFVRFQGCSVGCVNCDSKETWEFQKEGQWSAQQVFDEVLRISRRGRFPVKRLSITGGDPLHPKHEKNVTDLVDFFKAQGFYINIEASGTRVVPALFERVDYVSFDYKTPCTGVRTPFELLLKMAREFNGKFQVKSVVQDEKDFAYAFEAREMVLKNLGVVDFPWCLTPAFNTGEAFPKERFIFINQLNEEHGGVFRVIGQQHKFIYGSSEKNV